MRSRPVVLLAAACAIGLAAWVSQGALAVTDHGVNSRVGALPAVWWLVGWIAVAGAALATAVRRGVAWWPLLAPVVVLLPWLPVPVPVSALIWTGPMVTWVWLGTAVAVAASWQPGPGTSWVARVARDPRRAPWLALVLAFAAFWGSSRAVANALLNGDEPHYLVITQSLLEDRDLQVENNYVNGRYHDYFPGDLKPDFLRRGQNGEIYSVHAPGVPVLVLPVFAAAGYRGVVGFLALLAAIGSSVLWRAGYRLTLSASAAWFGWATVVAGAPTFFHAMLVYPDGAAMVFVAVALCALVALDAAGAGTGASGDRPGLDAGGDPVPWSAWRWGLVGLVLGVLPWLHTRLVVLAALLAGFLALRLLARRALGRAAAMLIVLGLSTAGWFGYFYAIYGELNPSAPYAGISQSTWANVPRGLCALLLDQQFGVVPNAPAFGVGLVGLVSLFRARRRLTLELAVLLVTYTLLVAGFHMWWGGHSAPARLLVPVLPLLALPAAVSWSRWRAAGRAMAGLGLTLSALITGSMVAIERGGLIFNDRDGVSQLLEWVTPVVDLPRSAPSFVRDAPGAALLGTAAWLAPVLAAAGALGLLAWWVRRKGGDVRGALALGTPLACCVAVMASASAGWKMAGVDGMTPPTSQLAFLRAFDPKALPNGGWYGAREWAPSGSIPGRLLLGASDRRPVAADGPLLFLVDVPPGVYRVSCPGAVAAEGSIEVYVARGREPVARWDLGPAWREGNHEVRLPVSVNALIVLGDAKARASMPRVALQPVSIVARGRRPEMPRASRAARYGDLVAYAFTPEVYLEGPGLWVLGGLPVPLALTVDPPATVARILLRNGPVPNTVALRGSGISMVQPLAPGEERVVQVPVDRAVNGAAVEVKAERGFRPADFDKTTKDVRYLGVWIQPAPRAASGR